MTNDANPPAIGIDLATTYSAIAYLDATGRPVSIVNSDGNLTTPSIVLFDDESVIVGEEAVRAMGAEADAIAAFAKRDMGERYYHRPIRGRQFPPQAIQACILRKLANDAIRQTGNFTNVVLTVPAYFDESKRKATQDAGYMAGLNVIDIINEPTAAALAVGYRTGFLDATGAAAGRQRLLVYDLGGGTFDVTIVEVEGDRFTTIATDGDFKLGGQDWDYRLVDHVAERFIGETGFDPREEMQTLSILWRNCEAAKRTLSVRKEASVTCEYRGANQRIKIQRDVFEAITSDLLERTLFTTRQIMREANFSWPDINRILLAGGSTRMPAVQRALRDMAGVPLDMSVPPEEAVAQGAALHAGLLQSHQRGSPALAYITNVNSHSLGVVGTDPATNKRRNQIMISRNTALPAGHCCRFYTARANQRKIHVEIVEGETLSPDGCIPVGHCIVPHLPGGLPKGTNIDVTLHYETNGRLRVHVKAGGVKVDHELVRQNSLTKEQLDQWREYVRSRVN